MRRTYTLITAAVCGALPLLATPALADCTDKKEYLPVSRVVEIDTSTGALFGDMTKYAKEDSFLAENEVVLTFDDGPMPNITTPILDALDRFCTKATFFSVGEMAIAYPAVTRDVVARGHTLGSHTWSHPNNLAHLSLEKATDQIDRGFAAVAMAAGQPVAPFFRFPGLNDSAPLLQHLQSKGVAAFTVDVVSNDSFIANPGTLLEKVKRQTAARHGGILLFHDIKKSTAKALPAILAWLQANNYKVVHLKPKAAMPAITAYDAELTAKLEKTAKAAPAPATAAVTAPETAAVATSDQPPVTSLAPAARVRVAAITTPEPEKPGNRHTHSKTRSGVASDQDPLPRPAISRKKRKSQQAGLFGF